MHIRIRTIYRNPRGCTLFKDYQVTIIKCTNVFIRKAMMKNSIFGLNYIKIYTILPFYDQIFRKKKYIRLRNTNSYLGSIIIYKRETITLFYFCILSMTHLSWKKVRPNFHNLVRQGNVSFFLRTVAIGPERPSCHQNIHCLTSWSKQKMFFESLADPRKPQGPLAIKVKSPFGY